MLSSMINKIRDYQLIQKVLFGKYHLQELILTYIQLKTLFCMDEVFYFQIKYKVCHYQRSQFRF